MKQSIDVIGLGTTLNVPSTAQAALHNAELIIGAQRHLAAIDCTAAETALYPSPIERLLPVIEQTTAQRTVVLASGDALFFGIGSWLLRHFDAQSLHFHANTTSVQSACARVGRPWQNMHFVSLHGRPLYRLRAVLAPGKTLAVLTDSHNTPNTIAQALVACGYPASSLHVCEALGSEAECVREFTAAQLSDDQQTFNPLNLLLITVRGGGGLLPVFPGISDAVFAVGGDTQFTKREVRLAALARLALGGGEIGWDIGAGCGGIAIEWARWAPQAQVFALERDAARCQVFENNRVRFGDHGNLSLIQGEAPAALKTLPDPDAIYLGGSGEHLSALLDTAWQRLHPGGRLVAAGVTLETRTALQNRTWPVAVELSDISISHAAPLGRQTTMRAQLPVLLATTVKPYD